MIKALILDGDGIVLVKRDKYFSQRMVEDLGIQVPEDQIGQFFKDVYPEIRLGKRELKVEVEKRMRDWGWQKSVEELLDYWFSYENKVDEQVLDLVRKLRKSGIKVYLASDHSKYRADDLMNKVGLKDEFDGGFFSCDLKLAKADGEFWQAVLVQLENCKPKEVMFWDDEEENVDAAKEIGVSAKLYENFEDFESEVLKSVNEL
jgi:putative hydrolase of the HAD superfamily